MLTELQKVVQRGDEKVARRVLQWAARKGFATAAKWVEKWAVELAST